MKENASLKSIGIAGMGVMGAGISQVTARAGYQVRVIDQDSSQIEKALKGLSRSLEKLVQKEILQPEDPEKILSRIGVAQSLEDFGDCDLIIEAVFEDLEIKKDLLSKLDRLCPPHTFFATNTSALSVSLIFSGLSRTDKTAGLHFFNPVSRMKLVEVVKTINTSAETLDTLFHFVRSIGKEPVKVRDQAGFLVNYLVTPYLFDAIRALEAGVSTIQEIDTAMRYGSGYPMGPFALCDLIGLDIILKGGECQFEEYREAKYAPPPLLKRLVEVGDLGYKSGRGFYDYQDPKNPEPRDLV